MSSADVFTRERTSLRMLRRGWINFDWLWCGALSVTGVLLIVTG